MLPIFSAILLIAGFYLLYNTSQRAEVPATRVRKWVRQAGLLTKCFGFALLLVSFFIFIIHYGVGAGFSIGLILPLSVAALTVLFIPVIHHKKQQADARKPQIFNAE